MDIIKGAAALDAFVRAAGAAPQAAALFCDIDGTISPIAARPSDAYVPETVRQLLSELVERLALVAFVSGRDIDDARRMVGLDGVAYVGTHGLDVQEVDGTRHHDPRADAFVERIREVAGAAARDLDCAALGVVLEDKHTVLAIHYRLAIDPVATRHQILTHVVEPARARGLSIATGHLVFEVRPPLPFTKGAAVRDLLRGDEYLAALVCGDDLTDVTAFTAIHEWGAHDARRAACALAAITEETPRSVTEDADVLVRATPGVHCALSRLRTAIGG